MNKKLIFFLLAVAFVFRFFLITKAHHGDLNNNISWGNEAVQRGIVNYYDGIDWPFSAPNQPPLYILLFAATSFIYKTVMDLSWTLNSKFSFFPSSFIWFWELYGMEYLVKIPSIICDFVIAFVIYKFFAKRNKNNIGVKISLLWLFNPLIWYNSSLWGQTDSIVNLLGLLSVINIMEKNIKKSFVYFTLSVLFKGSLLIFAPIILAVAIFQKYDVKTWVKAIFYSVLSVLVVSVWFHPAIDFPVWLFNLYTNRFFPGEIGSLTANAFNFWWLVDNGKTLDSAIFFGLPARVWGILTLLLSIIFSIFSLSKKVTEKKVLVCIAIVALTSFLFMTRIHERYLYPLFPYLTILVGFNSIWLIPLAILSTVSLINLYHLFWAPPILVLENVLINSQLSTYLSVINILVFLAIIILCVKPRFWRQ